MMWKSRHVKDTETSRHGDTEKSVAYSAPRVYLSHGFSFLFLLLLLTIATACRRDMQDQPKMKPLRGTSFFTDGLSGRQPVEGTIPRGYLRADTAFYTGKKRLPTVTTPGATARPSPTNSAPGQNTYPDDVETFPFPITKETVERGRERYDIFCAVCHGLTGNGDGMIVRRGFRRAASFNDDRLRQAPVGHFFDAVTNGWGAMPAYAFQIPVQDRWAIIAYIRALQLSQQNPNTSTASPAPTPTASPTPGRHQ
jgi:mono/diheme cytochrome c family protein